MTCARYCVILLILIIHGGPVAGGPRHSYFMLIFSQEGQNREPWLSHTFATFVKTTGSGSDKEQYKIESHTISWVPATLDIRLLRLSPEKGTNLDLDASLRLAKARNARISMWGPFQIQEELFQRAVRQVERLNQGKIAYKALDRRFRPDVASNCFHAVSDIDSDNGLLNTGATHGAEVTHMVLLHLKRWIIRLEEVHDWVARRIGVNDPAIRRLELNSLTTTPARED